jgi:DNA primase
LRSRKGCITMYADPTSTKYLVKAKINADGVVEKPDVVGAIFGQTEGLLGDELDLRELQKTGRIGRIEAEVTSKGGRSEGTVIMSSSLDQVETAIIASSLETVDRVGPCKASIKVISIEDVRVVKREKVIERAKELIVELIKNSKDSCSDITDSIRKSIQVEEITSYGKDKCPAGPNVEDADAIIVVEGRSDVLNCLRSGIKNAIAVEGTDIPKTIQDLSRKKTVTAFVDGDRGGELILKELFQVAEVDFVARAPRAQEVEELTQKQLVKCLRNKIPAEQYMEMNGITAVPLDRDETDEETKPARRENGDHNGKKEEKSHSKRERFSSEAAEKFKKKDAAHKKDEADDQKEEQQEEETDEPSETKPARTLRAKKSPRSEKVLTEEQIFYRDVLSEMASTHNAKLFDADRNVIKEIAAKAIYDTLKEAEDEVSSVVFDGVISQRIVDVSAEKGIETIVATRKGKISKMPAEMTLWAKEDFY